MDDRRGQAPSTFLSTSPAPPAPRRRQASEANVDKKVDSA